MSETLEMSLSTEQSSTAVEVRRNKPHIVIVGGGFGDISAAKALRHCDAEVVVIDRRNHHIFQPLLYQVATAVLSPSEVAAPIRQLEAKQKNVSVLLAEVVGVDLKSRSVDANCPGIGIRKIGFDYLVVAAGMQSSYFGHDEFAEYAPCLKTITDTETIRSKILSAYELAESTDDADERQRQMTFVLVGAGPTGVELAASLAQLATTTLRKNFRRLIRRQARNSSQMATIDCTRKTMTERPTHHRGAGRRQPDPAGTAPVAHKYERPLAITQKNGARVLSARPRLLRS
jgi:NADH dehydrogenase